MNQSKVLKFNFTPKGPDSWITQFAEQMNLLIKDNQVILPEALGEGFIKFKHISEGLYVTIMNIKFRQDLEITKLTVCDMDFFPIIFTYSDRGVRQEVNGKSTLIGKDTPNSITIPSAGIQSKVYVPADLQVVTLAVLLNKNWINDYLQQGVCENNEKISFLRELFFSQRNYLIYEALTPQMAEVLRAIFHHNYPHGLSRLFIQGKLLELLALFFDKLLQREFNNTYENINTEDIETLFLVKQMIMDQIYDPPTIATIARQIGMSESKLKKIFKQVFGYSIYQYILLNKMQRAKSLLDTKKYNVSEVGFELGYSNLAHFAKAFKKQYQISPSHYLSSLKG